MFILQPVLALMHFLSAACYYFLAISYHIGRSICCGLSLACNCLRDIFAAIAIIGEEFYRFLGELDVSIGVTLQYLRSSANNGIGGVIEGIALFVRQMSRFFTSTKSNSQLTATACGHFVVEFITLVRQSLVLIVDSAWWLLTIVPRTLTNLLIATGDGIVFSISGVMQLLTALVRNIIDDLFRYTILVAVFFLLVRNRRYLKRILRHIVHKIYVHTTQRRRLVNTSSVARIVRRDPLPQHSRSPLGSTDKLSESQRCVVCRDQLKCVLLLPCKHLCLCEECADHMTYANGLRPQCPLCRAEIRQSMSVYI